MLVNLVINRHINIWDLLRTLDLRSILNLVRSHNWILKEWWIWEECWICQNTESGKDMTGSWKKTIWFIWQGHWIWQDRAGSGKNELYHLWHLDFGGKPYLAKTLLDPTRKLYLIRQGHWIWQGYRAGYGKNKLYLWHLDFGGIPYLAKTLLDPTRKLYFIWQGHQIWQSYRAGYGKNELYLWHLDFGGIPYLQRHCWIQQENFTWSGKDIKSGKVIELDMARMHLSKILNLGKAHLKMPRTLYLIFEEHLGRMLPGMIEWSFQRYSWICQWTLLTKRFVLIELCDEKEKGVQVQLQRCVIIFYVFTNFLKKCNKLITCLPVFTWQ